MKKIIPLIFIFAFALSCKQNSEIKKSKNNSAVVDTVTTQIDKLNEAGKIVGFSVAMVDTTGVFYNKGFGYSDLASKKEYSTETIQYVASISKTLIGVSLMKAQEMGTLNLDDPINKYLSFEVVNPNFPNTPITIRQLAIHTSSIADADIFWENDYILINKKHPENTGIPKYFNEPKSRIPISEFLNQLLAKDGQLNNGESYSKNEPNQKFEYSNVGSILCALIIENATKMSFQEFTQKQILEPLKMNSSGWSIEDVNAKNRSTLYVTNKQRMADYATIGFPSTGFITSSNDLGKFLSELINGYSGKGKILSDKSYTELYKKQLIKSQLPEGATANVGIFIDYSKRGLGYNGYDAGLMAYMYFNPDNLIGKIITINTDTDYDEDVQKTLDEVWGLLSEFEDKFD